MFWLQLLGALQTCLSHVLKNEASDVAKLPQKLPRVSRFLVHEALARRQYLSLGCVQFFILDEESQCGSANPIVVTFLAVE